MAAASAEGSAERTSRRGRDRDGTRGRARRRPPRGGGPVRRRDRARSRRRRVALLGVRAEEDGDPRRQPGHRGPLHPGHGRRSQRLTGLGTGGTSHPRRGDRRLGRPGRRGPLRRQGRPVPARHRPDRGARRRRRRAAIVSRSTGRSWSPPAPRPELPSSIVVLGGGAAGVELGQVLARFGVRVAIVEAAPHLLRLEEPEVGEVVAPNPGGGRRGRPRRRLRDPGRP